MKDLLQRPQGRLIAGGAAIAIVVLLSIAIYVFGGNAAKRTNGPVTAATVQPSANGTVFTIDGSQSTVSFTMGEVLFGNPNTIVGKTNAVAGQIVIDKQDTAKSQVGQIKVDLSTLTTDNDFRNRALQGRILETGTASNQFAIFDAKTISGLSGAATVGQQVAFTIAGDLTMHGVTKPATFTAQATLTSDTALTGKATTTVKYKDFNMAIPSVPSVSNVTDDVTLEIDFTAKA